MRNPDRIDPMLDKIREIWNRNPDLRLMQLLHNYCKEISCDAKNFYFIEDRDLEEELDFNDLRD